jgi:predicted O-methyltransferase YrrM
LKIQQLLYRSWEFLKHYTFAGNEHGLHSPFVFGLYKRIIQNHGVPSYEDIDHYYYELLEDNHMITNENPGAGTTHHAVDLKIKQLAGGSIKNLPWRQLICRLLHERDPKVVIELGTSFGVTTAYIAQTLPDAIIYTFEANPSLIRYAKELWKELGIKNIVMVEGDIDTTLENVLLQLPQIDAAYMDANHRFEPTIRYASTLLDRMSDTCLLIVDDIYWSSEMTQAWEKLCKRNDIDVSIDLWQIGLLYRREGQVKESFKLKY